jgi:hypothetical protein
MSEPSENQPQPTLQHYFTEWGPRWFCNRAGKPLSVRSLEMKIREFNLPVIRTGNGILIDPAMGEARLREFATQRPPRSRGRPRKGNGALSTK